MLSPVPSHALPACAPWLQVEYYVVGEGNADYVLLDFSSIEATPCAEPTAFATCPSNTPIPCGSTCIAYGQARAILSPVRAGCAPLDSVAEQAECVGFHHGPLPCSSAVLQSQPCPRPTLPAGHRVHDRRRNMQ